MNLSDPSERAACALRVFAAAPGSVGGLWIRARPSAARDSCVAALAPLNIVRISPNIDDTALFGGLDVAATLAEGRPVSHPGLLQGTRPLMLAMAERCMPALAARLSQAMDTGRTRLIALDEGAEPEETLPTALSEQMGLFISLDDIRSLDLPKLTTARLATVATQPGDHRVLVETAMAFGVETLRAPLQALAIARVLAGLSGRATLSNEDLQNAATLAFAHRATRMPEAEANDQPAPEPPKPSPENDTAQNDPNPGGVPDDLVVEAVRAALPADLLTQLTSGQAPRSAQGARGTGSAKKGNRRGRPLPSRSGRLDGSARIDIIATLRAAAPWQTLRKTESVRDKLVHLRSADIRIRQFQERSDRLLIFVVDASGSAAMARLAEAKGAVELLLSQAYARRDHVALIAFRGTDASLLLPPTRSLVQTKRRLAGLPGGGGTPLAAGLNAAMALGVQASRQGFTPSLALLTDGRANIALDGAANRARAMEDVETVARAIRHQRLPGVLIDTGRRPTPALADLAKLLDMPYLPMPRSDAERLADTISVGLAR